MVKTFNVKSSVVSILYDAQQKLEREEHPESVMFWVVGRFNQVQHQIQQIDKFNATRKEATKKKYTKKFKSVKK